MYQFIWTWNPVWTECSLFEPNGTLKVTLISEVPLCFVLEKLQTKAGYTQLDFQVQPAGIHPCYVVQMGKSAVTVATYSGSW